MNPYTTAKWLAYIKVSCCSFGSLNGLHQWHLCLWALTRIHLAAQAASAKDYSRICLLRILFITDTFRAGGYFKVNSVVAASNALFSH